MSNPKSFEAFVDKPLGFVEGIALSVGRSRNNNIYSVDECKNVTKKLLGAPMFYEHVNAAASIGKVVETNFDGFNVHYKAAIFDAESWNRIKTGTITNVSIGFNYQYAEPVNGQLMHNLDNLELSLVALGGVPNASIAPVKNEHLLQPFAIGEHVGVEPYRSVEKMEDVSLRDILDAAAKKKKAAAIAESVAALETALRAKIDAENAAKNAAAAAAVVATAPPEVAAAAPTTPKTEELTLTKAIQDEVAKQVKKQLAEQKKEGGEK